MINSRDHCPVLLPCWLLLVRLSGCEPLIHGWDSKLLGDHLVSFHSHNQGTSFSSQNPAAGLCSFGSCSKYTLLDIAGSCGEQLLCLVPTILVVGCLIAFVLLFLETCAGSLFRLGERGCQRTSPERAGRTQ